MVVVVAMVVAVVIAGYYPNGRCVCIRIWCLRAIVCPFVRVEKFLSWAQEQQKERERKKKNRADQTRTRNQRKSTETKMHTHTHTASTRRIMKLKEKNRIKWGKNMYHKRVQRFAKPNALTIFILRVNDILLHVNFILFFSRSAPLPLAPQFFRFHCAVCITLHLHFAQVLKQHLSSYELVRALHSSFRVLIFFFLHVVLLARLLYTLIKPSIFSPFFATCQRALLIEKVSEEGKKKTRRVTTLSANDS